MRLKIFQFPTLLWDARNVQNPISERAKNGKKEKTRKNLLGKVLECQMECQVWLLSLHRTNSSSWSSNSSHMLFGLLTFPDWRLLRTPPPRRAKAEAVRRTSRAAHVLPVLFYENPTYLDRHLSTVLHYVPHAFWTLFNERKIFCAC